jgi:hypothetical protein
MKGYHQGMYKKDPSDHCMETDWKESQREEMVI